jgi:hypothetical protein
VRFGQVIFTSAALLVGACANVEYPKDWSPSVKADSGCLPISGTYENRPSSVVPEGAPAIELRSFFLVREIRIEEWVAPSQSDIHTVTLRQDGEFLVVKERRLESTQTTRLRIYPYITLLYANPLDGVGCLRGGWERRSKVMRGHADLLGVTGEDWVWQVFKGEDGSLAIRLVSGRFETIGLVPTSVEKFSWYRYRSVP